MVAAALTGTGTRTSKFTSLLVRVRVRLNVHAICAGARYFAPLIDNYIGIGSGTVRRHLYCVRCPHLSTTSRGGRSTPGTTDHPAADEDGWDRRPMWTHPLQREAEHVEYRHGGDEGIKTTREGKMNEKIRKRE
jgi:hypothetical protein